MDTMPVWLIVASIGSFYAGVMATIIIVIKWGKPKRNQLINEEAHHGHTNPEEDIHQSAHRHQAAVQLVPDPEGFAQWGTAVEIAEANEYGEICGYGAAWACYRFGQDGHDYLFCPQCNENYRLHIRRSAQRRAA